MARVRLLATRTRGDLQYAVGAEYECSDAEAGVLVADGYAEKVGPRDAPASTPEPEPEPEPEAKPKTTRRKA